jgi:hypothetical protein
VKCLLPGVALSTDMMAGFCGESEADHEASMHLMQSVRYDQAFLFAYSDRERTHAARHYQVRVLACLRLGVDVCAMHMASRLCQHLSALHNEVSMYPQCIWH